MLAAANLLLEFASAPPAPSRFAQRLINLFSACVPCHQHLRQNTKIIQGAIIVSRVHRPQARQFLADQRHWFCQFANRLIALKNFHSYAQKAVALELL